MDLSVVVVSYNVRDLLADCLQSVQQGADGAYEVVVDNASADGSAQMVVERFPDVQVVANHENRGFAAATNQGIRLTHGACVLLLNPDTRVLGRAVGDLVAFMARTPRAGMVGPQLVYADGSFQHSAFRFPSLPQIFLDFFPLHHRLLDSRLNGRYPRRWYQKGEPFAIDHPLGAAMLVRREAMEQVGLLDEGFFMYCEEVDWAMRMHRAGWGIYTLPQARIVHYAGQSTRQFRDRMFVELWRSRERLFRKHYSPLFRRAAHLLIRIGLWRERQRLAGVADASEREARMRAYEAVLALQQEGDHV